MTDGLRRVGGTLLWLAVIVAIALGAAGIVTGMDHPPTAPAAGPGASAGRDPGFTVQFPGDEELTDRLDTATTDLETLADKVDALGTQARTALAALNGLETDKAEAAVSAGDDLVTEIVARSARLRADLADMPYIGTPDESLTVSDTLVERHAALVDALDATDGLDVDWARLSAGALSATRMGEYLAEHDTLIGQAVKKGRLAKYDEATALIDKASLQLDTAVAERDELMKTVDVSVLDEWISRNRDYDVALKTLYVAIEKVGHKVTNETRKAVKAEAAARARLPPDDRGLVIIMADIGRSGMNGAIIDIEEAHAKLGASLDDLAPQPSSAPSADPSGAPGASSIP